MKVNQTAFLDLNMDWKVEMGEFEIQIGSSSEDIRLKDSFFVKESGVAEGKNRGFYAEAQVRK